MPICYSDMTLGVEALKAAQEGSLEFRKGLQRIGRITNIVMAVGSTVVSCLSLLSNDLVVALAIWLIPIFSFAVTDALGFFQKGQHRCPTDPPSWKTQVALGAVAGKLLDYLSDALFK